MRSLLRRVRRDASAKLDVGRLRDAIAASRSGVSPETARLENGRSGRRRSFGPPDLDAILRLTAAATEVATLRDAIRAGGCGSVVSIRHDTDHDIDNAVRFARWEFDHGIRASYFVLHTDWYWGSNPGRPSRYVLRALDRIASLGHEIGLHNNAITAGLLVGRDPIAVLEAALAGLRRHGFDVVGTVAHGDPLCHTLGFVNYELFADLPAVEGRQRPRQIETRESDGPRRRITIRPVPMAELGLEYEANFSGHKSYLSDTGGTWRRRTIEEATAEFLRQPSFTQVLLHPVWWALEGERYEHRPVWRDPLAGETGSARGVSGPAPG
jgi:hypothetical protein